MCQTIEAARQQRLDPIVYRAVPIAAIVVWALYVCGSWAEGSYFEAMTRLGIPAHERPFVDLYQPLLWLECNEQGIDIFHPNSCSPRSAFNYGPILLALSGSGLSSADSRWLGVTLLGLTLVSILCLLRPRTLGQGGLCAAVAA